LGAGHGGDVEKKGGRICFCSRGKKRRKLDERENAMPAARKGEDGVIGVQECGEKGEQLLPSAAQKGKSREVPSITDGREKKPAKGGGKFFTIRMGGTPGFATQKPEKERAFGGKMVYTQWSQGGHRFSWMEDFAGVCL